MLGFTRFNEYGEFEIQRDNYVIPPFKLKNETRPIEAMMAGFGCILVKKEVNDNCSLIAQSVDWFVSEDFTFCRDARKKGYRLFVDPTCHCDHQADKVRQGLHKRKR